MYLESRVRRLQGRGRPDSRDQVGTHQVDQNSKRKKKDERASGSAGVEYPLARVERVLEPVDSQDLKHAVLLV